MQTVQPSRPVALVAGASRGLGLLVARELIRRDHDVAVCARTEGDLERAVEMLRRGAPDAAGLDGGAPSEAPRVRGYVCDVGDQDAVERLVADVERDLGPVEVLISVAGTIQVGPAETMTVEHFEEAVATMLMGPVRLAWAVLPGMRERGHGRIGTVTSIGGKVAPPHLLPYVTAKFGAVGFSEGLSAELAGSGVTATTIVPGLMRTGSHERALFTGDRAAEFAWFGPAASMPLLSADAERAARRMVDGVLAGRTTVVITPLASLGMRVHGLMPATTVRVMGLVSRLLPDAPGRPDDSATVEGRQAARALDSSVVRALTTLGRRAAARLNERGPATRPGPAAS
ncbi:MAG: short-chain dehydrogenase [Acidobacteria bacterium]|nr:MAG: short-chain dehydrogenase [Acidobacteriota bacterium]